MKKTPYILLATLILATFSAFAQKAERSDVRKGNRQYEKKKFTEAEIQYRKALEVNPHSKEGTYNLGNALYKQNKPNEAMDQYQAALNLQNDPKKKSEIFHNAGNVQMTLKQYDKAVDLYKNSLKINPGDNETRYNLALAQSLLKKQQQQQKQNKDKKKDQKDDQKDKQQQQQKQDDQEKKQNQNKKQDQQQQQQEQVSKEKARQLLDALSQDEKDTQEKVKKLQMQQSKSRKTDKDW
ncbi:MAG TPA: tetratricopeptide repeat protein [Bacteroidales bacterium]|nr:tetratricopeptide repeat protein [Bacteroidales bacterium]